MLPVLRNVFLVIAAIILESNIPKTYVIHVEYVFQESLLFDPSEIMLVYVILFGYNYVSMLCHLLYNVTVTKDVTEFKVIRLVM